MMKNQTVCLVTINIRTKVSALVSAVLNTAGQDIRERRKVQKMISHVRQATNADFIRAMTDDELAKFLAKQKYKRPTFDGWVPLCNSVMGPRICHENGCRKCWLDWLKQEVDDDGT